MNDFKHTPGPYAYDMGIIMSTVPTIGGRSQELSTFRIADVRGWGHLQYNKNGEEEQEANGTLLAASPILLQSCIMQHQAIDLLFARLVQNDKQFFPSKSGLPWEAIVAANIAISIATGKPYLDGR